MTCLNRLAKKSELDVRIALDEHLVGLPETLTQDLELEYWWGPKFSEELGAIDLGVTRHEECDEIQRFYRCIASTEFWWYKQDNRLVFECEELRDRPTWGVGADSYGCRFAHAMADESKSRIQHADGAVRMYDEEAMVKRLNEDISKSGRQTKYTKLWRVDGPLEVSAWKGLLTQFYRDDLLIGEYFGAVSSVRSTPKSCTAVHEDGHEESALIHGHMENGQGIRIAISYRPCEQISHDLRQIDVLDSILYDGGRAKYIEANTREIIKLLRRQGESVAFEDDVMLLEFEDTVDNLPLFLHFGQRALVLAEMTRAGNFKNLQSMGFC